MGRTSHLAIPYVNDLPAICFLPLNPDPIEDHIHFIDLLLRESKRFHQQSQFLCHPSFINGSTELLGMERDTPHLCANNDGSCELINEYEAAFDGNHRDQDVASRFEHGNLRVSLYECELHHHSFEHVAHCPDFLRVLFVADDATITLRFELPTQEFLILPHHFFPLAIFISPSPRIPPYQPEWVGAA